MIVRNIEKRGMMPRKDNRDNPLQIGLRVISLPKVSPKRFHQRLIQFIDEGRPLPSSWQVEVRWRNPKTKHRPQNATWKWQTDDFESAVSESADRGGFNMILRDALVRRLRRFV